jgi:tetratricopeptide (TPR) repeat protein
MNSTCLTYNQLQAYSAHTIEKSEREHLYMHISSCELCACAVNGFTAIPFDSDELVATHREIDSKVNAASVNPLTFAQVIIVIISLVSILGVYKICDRLSIPNASSLNKKESILINSLNKNETKKTSQEEISSAAKTIKKIVNVIQYHKFSKKLVPFEKLENIKSIAFNQSILSEKEIMNDVMSPHYNPDAIYIYDLKVSGYNKLYFNHLEPDVSFFKGHIPVFRENEKSKEDEIGFDQHNKIPMDRILKNGLAAFNKQHYEQALVNFDLLMEYNPDDVNAQFYSALCYFNLNKLEKTIESLNDVIGNANDAFYPEAQWYLALATFKSGDKENAILQLQKIVFENGFYCDNAKDKLKKMQIDF